MAEYILGAMVVSHITASFKFQFQALFYLLAVIFGSITTIEGFTLFTGLHIVFCLFSAAYRGATADR